MVNSPNHWTRRDCIEALVAFILFALYTAALVVWLPAAGSSALILGMILPRVIWDRRQNRLARVERNNA